MVSTTLKVPCLPAAALHLVALPEIQVVDSALDDPMRSLAEMSQAARIDDTTDSAAVSMGFRFNMPPCGTMLASMLYASVRLIVCCPILKTMRKLPPMLEASMHVNDVSDTHNDASQPLNPALRCGERALRPRPDTTVVITAGNKEA